MLNKPSEFTAKSLYIAGFAQARAPHQALIIPSDTQSGTIVHIRIDRATAPTWAYQSRVQKIEGDMFLSSLLKIHDISAGEITVDQLQQAGSVVPVPDNDEFGECGPWVCKVVEKLHEMGLVQLEDIEELRKEFSEFAAGNKAFARRDRFPNVSVSKFCT
ncbi:hypothetical protein ABKN59_010219 [Abortiporus biennis]